VTTISQAKQLETTE